MPRDSRRDLPGSEESNQQLISPAYATDANMSLQLLSLLEDTTTPAPPAPPLLADDIELQRLLSVHSVVSICSSNAEQQARAEIESIEAYTKIGAGSCGAVFAQAGNSVVLKLAKTTNFSLWNDFGQHLQIFEGMKKFPAIEIKIPECFYYYKAEDAVLYLNKHPALADVARDICNLPTTILATQRIHPLPETTRAHLINKYCPARIKSKARADPANKDCLVRVYLGSVAGKAAGGGMFFSLRNFKLHLNHIIELQLDARNLSIQIAQSLAVMHWAALTDARDVEFVLGSSAEEIRRDPVTTAAEVKSNGTTQFSTGPESCMHEDFFHRNTELWLLDFNLVKDINLEEKDTEVLEKLVSAHNANDPYYPKPCQQHPVAKMIWNDFVKAYLETASLALHDKSIAIRELPARFLQRLIDQERARRH